MKIIKVSKRSQGTQDSTTEQSTLLSALFTLFVKESPQTTSKLFIVHEVIRWQISCQFKQTESTSAVKFCPLENNAYLFPAYQFDYGSLSYLSY